MLFSTDIRRIAFCRDKQQQHCKLHQFKMSSGEGVLVRRSARLATQRQLECGQVEVETSVRVQTPKRGNRCRGSTKYVTQQQEEGKENAPLQTQKAESCIEISIPHDSTAQVVQATGKLGARQTDPSSSHASIKARCINSSGRSKKPVLKPVAGPSRAAEEALWSQGFEAVAGVDEAGRGPLAGPVVAAAAVLPADVQFDGLNDSKQMTEEARDELYDQLTTNPDVKWAVAVVDHETIDEINILQAAMLAMQKAVEGLSSKPDHLLIDGNRRPKGLEHMPMQTLVKGDATSTCIAAASVIAKVTRDRLMLELHEQYPQYGFAQHKGYGVPAHKAAIQEHGPCPVHRRSFEPVKSITGWQGYGQKAAAAAQVAQQTQEEEADNVQANAPTCKVENTPAMEVGSEKEPQQNEVAVQAHDVLVIATDQAQQSKQPKPKQKRRKQEDQVPQQIDQKQGKSDGSSNPQGKEMDAATEPAGGGTKRRRRKA